LVKFLFLSFIFHLALLVIFKIETVNFRKSKEKAINISLSQENQALKNQDIPKKEIKPKKKVKKEISKKEIKPKKKVKKEISEKEIKPKKKVKKEITKKEIKPKKKVKKEITKKTIEKPYKKEFDDLLKNLAKEDLNQEIKESFDKKINELAKQTLIIKNKPSKNKLDKNELSAIEKLLLKQIDEKWSRPPGITISKDLVIKMIVYLDINGKVINLEIHKQTINDINNNYRLQPYLESAIRAIKKASPFEGLRKDRYNNWKELIINFKPIEAR